VFQSVLTCPKDELMENWETDGNATGSGDSPVQTIAQLSL
jgi:hypothetical protein